MLTDICIIGGGPAGLTASIYARRAGFSALVLDQAMFGGQAASTNEIENYPAIQKISGVDFAMQLYAQAEAQGAELRSEQVTGVDLAGEIKTVFTTSGPIQARAVIIANGAKRRKLGCPGEDELAGRGVSYCATCDGAFFKNRPVAIVGGGNTALEDALFLSNNCSRVYLIHRRDSFRGERVMDQAVRSRENIQLLLESRVERILGKDKVEAVAVTGPNGARELAVSAVFVAVGMEPDNGLFAPHLPLDKAGYLSVDETCATPIPGVYAAGDTRTTPLRQIITAAADGAVAAVAAASYLNAR